MVAVVHGPSPENGWLKPGDRDMNHMADRMRGRGNGKGIRGVRRVLALCFLMAPLAGCGGIEAPFLAAVSTTAMIINEGKVPTDYIAEAATGLDCNYIRSTVDKGPLCRPLAQREVIERPVYCYRTIASPNCYNKPDPYNIGARTIN